MLCLVAAPTPCRFLTFRLHVFAGYQSFHSSLWMQLLPLSPSNVWPPLAITRCCRLALTSDSELLCLVCLKVPVDSPYFASARIQQKTPPPIVYLLLRGYLLRRSRDLAAVETFLQSHCLVTDSFSRSEILALSGFDTILSYCPGSYFLNLTLALKLNLTFR
jgi:hypothetical protein